MTRLAPARSASRGLGPIASPARGVLIGFATAPGEIALDGGDRNSPYTAALLRHLPTPGVSIADAMVKVAAAVERATGGSQSPWLRANMTEIVRLAPARPRADAVDQEAEDWRFASADGGVAALDAYRSAYCPIGRFCALASARLAALGVAQDGRDPALAETGAPGEGPASESDNPGSVLAGVASAVRRYFVAPGLAGDATIELAVVFRGGAMAGLPQFTGVLDDNPIPQSILRIAAIRALAEASDAGEFALIGDGVVTIGFGVTRVDGRAFTRLSADGAPEVATGR